MNIGIFEGLALLATALIGGGGFTALVSNYRKQDNVNFQTLLRAYENITETLKKDIVEKDSKIRELEEQKNDFREELIRRGHLAEVQEIDKKYAN
jgi:hypothetical protein